MENKEQEIVDRLEAATTLLERTLGWLEERQGVLSGEVEKIRRPSSRAGGKWSWRRSWPRLNRS